MKNTWRLGDISFVAMLLTAVAAPSFAVNAPQLGAAAGFTIIDSATANAQARLDAQRAYNELFGSACVDITNQDLNNQRFAPGVYCINKNSDFNGQVVLDAQGNENAVFVFRVNGKLSVWPDSIMQLVGGARSQNVFWAINGLATFGTNARAAGTFIAVGPISFGRGGDNPIYDERGLIDGRLISLNDRVTASPLVSVGFIPSFVSAPLPPSYIPPAPVISAPASTGIVTVVNNDPHFVVFVDGLRVENGQRVSVVPGAHTVSEVVISDAQYWMPVWSGDCAGNGLNGIVTVNAGDQKTCAVTNALAVSGALPGLPNTGASGPYLTLLNLFGLALIGILLWEERRFKASLS